MPFIRTVSPNKSYPPKMSAIAAPCALFVISEVIGANVSRECTLKYASSQKITPINQDINEVLRQTSESNYGDFLNLVHISDKAAPYDCAPNR